MSPVAAVEAATLAAGAGEERVDSALRPLLYAIEVLHLHSQTLLLPAMLSMIRVEALQLFLQGPTFYRPKYSHVVYTHMHTISTIGRQ